MAKSNKVIISCAVTGAIHTPTMSDALPVTPDEIAAQSIAAAEAGAAILHLHARDPADGRPTPDPAVFMQFLPRIKQSTDAVINVTTGGGLGMTLEERLAAALAAKPEMASLNMGSMNFGIFQAADKYADWKYDWEEPYLRMTDDFIFRNTFKDIEYILKELGEGAGTKFEHECYDIGHLYNTAHFLDRGLLKPPIFIQSIFGILGGIGAEPDNLIFMRRTADRLFGDDYVWSVLAAGRHQMAFTTQAAMLGGNVRVGLEDSLYAAKGKLATSNAEQVTKIRRILGSCPSTSRPPARPATCCISRAATGSRSKRAKVPIGKYSAAASGHRPAAFALAPPPGTCPQRLHVNPPLAVFRYLGRRTLPYQCTPQDIRMVRMRIPLLLAIATISLVPGLTTARADGPAIAFGPQISTLGLGGEAGLRFNDFVGLHGGGNYFTLDFDNNVNSTNYAFELDLVSAGGVVDLHPFGGGFRVSGGVRWNGNNASLRATPNGTILIGDTTFTAAQAGSLSGDLDFETFAPLASVGYQGSFFADRVQLSFDLGVLFQGDPNVTLNASGTLANDPTPIPMARKTTSAPWSPGENSPPAPARNPASRPATPSSG